MIQKFNDIHDWQSIELGNFRKNNVSFNLRTFLKEIEIQMQDIALIKRLKLEFYSNFIGVTDISRTVNLHTLMRDVFSKNFNFCYKKEIQKFIVNFDESSHILPTQVIGDPNRLQQVAINLI